MSNVTYSFVHPDNQKDTENLVFESKVSSFGIDHVSQKDLLSFYTKFSEKAYFDSGLLPVDGSGMLSIRSAGDHTQIGYQYAPGKYYINWGAYERDPDANSIYVAQPYRIVIADIVGGNLYGARTFYSPIPVQHPDTPLYHVNLPNINCKGYRGNAVGWICLYHTEDIRHFPFSEKVVKILERCSGVETYNDANMSETDGPRFYKEYYKPSYIYDPQQWEAHSQLSEDANWTLDPDLWIPVLVKDMDNQDKHYVDGSPLTYVQAILGKYQSYYSDKNHLKTVNKISRGELTNKEVFQMFKSTYNDSYNFGMNPTNGNVYANSVEVREQNSKIFVKPIPVFEDEDSSTLVCDYCSEEYDEEETSMTILHGGSTMLCEYCLQEHAVYVSHIDAYVYSEDNELIWSNELEEWFIPKLWDKFVTCDCGHKYAYNPASGFKAERLPVYADSNGMLACTNCMLNTDLTNCVHCNKEVPKFATDYEVHAINYGNEGYKSVCNSCFHTNLSHAEKNVVLTPDSRVMCICGEEHALSEMAEYTYYQDGYSQTINFNYQLLSDVSKLVGYNPEVLSNHGQYHSIESVNLPITLLNITAHISHLCPNCMTQAALNEQNGLTTTDFADYLRTKSESSLKEMHENSNIEKLYGTVLKAISFF